MAATTLTTANGRHKKKPPRRDQTTSKQLNRLWHEHHNRIKNLFESFLSIFSFPQHFAYRGNTQFHLPPMSPHTRSIGCELRPVTMDYPLSRRLTSFPSSTFTHHSIQRSLIPSKSDRGQSTNESLDGGGGGCRKCRTKKLIQAQY